jgi:hypothetical protein
MCYYVDHKITEWFKTKKTIGSEEKKIPGKWPELINLSHALPDQLVKYERVEEYKIILEEK